MGKQINLEEQREGKRQRDTKRGREREREREREKREREREREEKIFRVLQIGNAESLEGR